MKIVFTDLDGTLLDHENYSFDGAKESVSMLSSLKIPLIIVTSKTYDEVVKLQRKLKLFAPFIVENGGGLYIPEDYDFEIITPEMQKLGNYYLLPFGKPISVIRNFISKNLSKHIEGFGDFSIHKVMELTNLKEEEASLSKSREFSEPFILKPDVSIDEVLQIVENSPYKITKGGRFYHLIAKEQDKGVAVRKTTNLYMKSGFERVVTFGLGDSKNDIPMLKSVDYPFLIRKFNGSYEDIYLEKLVLSKENGSKGWNEVVLANILN